VPYVGEGVVRVHKLLTAHWLTECAVTWFPEGIPGYDEQIVQLASKMAS